ncbi:MAG: GNAT family N-acetyltransferase [Neomegalonema sp.]|nr:GNAT family N-acetyltransferase [Neomegalonema sp.]
MANSLGGRITMLAGGPRLVTDRLVLRPPKKSDYEEWAYIRGGSQEFLRPWEPRWTPDHLSLSSFKRRVAWAKAEVTAGRSFPFLIFAEEAAMRGGVAVSAPEEEEGAAPARTEGLVGGVTIEHVRRGASMSAALGYWLGQGFVERGYMTEALAAVIEFAFDELGLSRLEAACLPENFRSRRLLERCYFTEESRAAAYLQIDGVWRDHLIYERRRPERVGV